MHREAYRKMLAELIARHKNDYASLDRSRLFSLEGSNVLVELMQDLHNTGIIILKEIATFTGKNVGLIDLSQPFPTPLRDEDEYIATYSLENFGLATQWIEVVNQQPTINPLIQKNISEFGATPEQIIGDFVIFDSGQITYMGNLLRIERRLLDIFILLLKQANKAITFDDLQDIRQLPSAVPRNTLAKYVADLRKALSEQLQPSPVSIQNIKNSGYMLMYPDAFRRGE